ncbi:DUF5709 domain-containing protein [Microbispora catharanthi]|uniref:DUF5709 domain-containing protein n=1 Tax=Microbispora catharanthi TaxID=1712871 RepID=A0A5N6BML9_9ACTN|nr:DUF5709 domain-containing protein [Microbispora catharanthi]KAB8181645.1 hypothetical protein FH610_027475 [Microbispora catharanthi]
MRENRPQPDPRSRFEDEGIPDLQEGTPEQQWAEDPQEMPLPGDRPLGLDEYGTTPNEMREGESLRRRLSREVPDVDVRFGTEPGTAGGPDVLGESGDQPYERYGAGTAESGQAGRLVDPDGGMGVDTEKDMIAEDVGPDFGGYTAEEQAMRIEDETP